MPKDTEGGSKEHLRRIPRDTSETPPRHLRAHKLVWNLWIPVWSWCLQSFKNLLRLRLLRHLSMIISRKAPFLTFAILYAYWIYDNKYLGDWKNIPVSALPSIRKVYSVDVDSGTILPMKVNPLPSSNRSLLRINTLCNQGKSATARCSISV